MLTYNTMEDITDILEKSKCYCMNEQSPYTLHNMLEQPNENIGIKSQVDHELIIQFSFRQKVTLSSIEYFVDNNEETPRLIKLYLNKTNLDFSSIEGEHPNATHRVNNIENKQKFNFGIEWKNTDTLTLFVAKNYGGEISLFKNIKIYGKPVECLNVNNIKKGCCC